jgi:hypothetical protein
MMKMNTNKITWNAENITLAGFLVIGSPLAFHATGLITLSGISMFGLATAFGIFAYAINWGR